MKLLAVLLMTLLCCTGCGSKTKESLYAEGVKQLNASNPNGAVVYFKNALEKDGNFADARFQLAKAYVALGKSEQAEKEFSKVLKQNPSRDDVVLELAKLYNGQGKGAEGLQMAQQYLEKHPGTVEALETVAIALAVNKRYDEAEARFQQAIAQEPQRAKTRLELASVLYAAGKPEQSRAFLDQVLRLESGNVRALFMLATLERGGGRPDAAAACYQRILQADPSQTLAAYKLGLIQIEKGALDQAEQAADELIKKFPKKGDGYRLKGLVSFYRKRYTEAVASLQTSLKLAPTAEGYHFLGLCYYNMGELESALSQFRIILDKIPKARQARLMTGQILLAQKRNEDGIAEIKKVLQEDDSDALAHNLLGSAYMSQGLFEEGMRELNQATRLDPKMVTAHVKKGYFFFSRGKNSEAETELATAVQAAPDVLNSRLLLASYYLRQAKLPKALALLQAGLTGTRADAPLYNAIAAVQFLSNKKGEGLKSLEKGKQVDPLFAASYQNLATYYAATGDHQRAIAEYGSLLQKDPKNVRALLGLAVLNEISGKESDAVQYFQKATETKAMEAYLAFAGFYQKTKNPEKALKVLDEAIKVAPRAIAPLEVKGRVLLGAKKYKEALKAFDEVEMLDKPAGVALKIGAYVAMQDGAKAVEQARRLIARNPSMAKGYLVLASVYMGQKDLNSALKEVNNAIRIEPRSVEAHLFLGRIYEQRREFDQAMSSYQDALKLQPDSVPAMFARGALLDQVGKKKEAVNQYRAILEKSDSFAPALNNLAYLCADGYGNREEALRLAINAFKLAPGDAGVIDTVGYSLLMNGRKAEAVKVLEKAASLLPKDPSVRYHLGLAYKEAGDRARAQQSLQQALSLGVTADTAKVRALLAEMKR